MDSSLFGVKFGGNSAFSFDKERSYYGPVNIKKLHIRLIDKNGEMVDYKKTNYALT